MFSSSIKISFINACTPNRQSNVHESKGPLTMIFDMLMLLAVPTAAVVVVDDGDDGDDAVATNKFMHIA